MVIKDIKVIYLILVYRKKEKKNNMYREECEIPSLGVLGVQKEVHAENYDLAKNYEQKLMEVLMTEKRKRLVGVDENGRYVGEYHPRAKLSDEQVDWLRELYEEGFVGYRTLVRAAWWLWQVQVPRNTLIEIVRYNRRIATVMDFRVVQG